MSDLRSGAHVHGGFGTGASNRPRMPTLGTHCAAGVEIEVEVLRPLLFEVGLLFTNRHKTYGPTCGLYSVQRVQYDKVRGGGGQSVGTRDSPRPNSPNGAVHVAVPPTRHRLGTHREEYVRVTDARTITGVGVRHLRDDFVREYAFERISMFIQGTAVAACAFSARNTLWQSAFVSAPLTSSSVGQS